MRRMRQEQTIQFFKSLEDFISAIEEAVFKILRHIIMLELGKLLF